MIEIADKNTVGFMGPEQAKKLDKAITTDSGQVLTSPTINGGALSGTFNGTITRTGLDVFSLGTATTGTDYVRFSPTDAGTGKPSLTIAKRAPVDKWAFGLWDGTNTNGTIDILCSTFTWNDSPVMTRGATETVTGVKNFSAGNAATAIYYTTWAPSDWGAGVSRFFIYKFSGNNWRIGTEEFGGAVIGGLDIQASSLTYNNNAIATLNGPVFTLPPRLPSYTVATVPSAATYVRGMIYVSDGTSNKRLAISDGTNWRFPDGAIVS